MPFARQRLRAPAILRPLVDVSLRNGICISYYLVFVEIGLSILQLSDDEHLKKGKALFINTFALKMIFLIH
jgi:hypothetical protein